MTALAMIKTMRLWHNVAPLIGRNRSAGTTGFGESFRTAMDRTIVQKESALS
jgi:hypothetical protein